MWKEDYIKWSKLSLSSCRKSGHCPLIGLLRMQILMDTYKNKALLLSGLGLSWLTGEPNFYHPGQSFMGYSPLGSPNSKRIKSTTLLHSFLTSVTEKVNINTQVQILKG
ncbi:hypothetical protein QVD17_38403 [Tagetes erecta]|uniref:Uncharacterized protein n=1 Tax=Tagetes erecta TaxID=13708 RepID=A0AAD8JS36_TARER|nr:hypothetical protein QVD17_38403 [Tagetes erecta]